MKFAQKNKKKLTEVQLRMIKYYAEKADLDFEEVLEWVVSGRTTLDELSKGILGKRVK